MPVTLGRAEPNKKSGCQIAAEPMLAAFFSKFTGNGGQEKKPEREEKAEREGDMCVLSIQTCRDFKGKIEGEMQTEWLSSLTVSKQRPTISV